MPTVEDALKEACTAFQLHKVPDYILDARVLLAHATRTSSEYIVLYPEKTLTEEAYRLFQSYVERRQKREPVSHITGCREFWGLPFTVTSKTLAPRPDSETLIEAVIKRCPDRETALRIIDLGTGTGCLLLALLKEYPQATGIGIDCDPETLAVAKANALHLNLEKRSSFLLQCWTEGVTGEFDVIITNPPYIKDADIEELQPEVALYEPRKALSGGKDGLECYRQLSPYLHSLIKKEGFAVLECGYNQAKEVSALLTQNQLHIVSYGYDLAGIARCIVAVKAGS